MERNHFDFNGNYPGKEKPANGTFSSTFSFLLSATLQMIRGISGFEEG